MGATSRSGTPTWFVADGTLKLDGRNYYSTNAIGGNAQFFRLATE